MRSLAILLALAVAAPAASQQTVADPSRVYGLHEVEVLPRPQNVADFTEALRNTYPPHLRDGGVGGTVQVAFIVGPDGAPGDVRVISTPDSGFSAPTVQAVSLLRFTPAQVQGRPVAVRVEQPITWKAAAAPVIPDSIQVYAVEDVEVRPVPLNFRGFEAARRQLYPQGLRSPPARAEVVARFAVDPAGEARYAHVLQSSDERFNTPTLRAIRLLRFRPAERNGAPAWVWLDVPVGWTEPEAYQDTADSRGGSANGYELNRVEVLPRLVNGQVFGNALRHAYPPSLRDTRVEGTVTVRFRVEVDGTISHAMLVHATDDRFIEPTLQAVQLLRFRPARLNGRPVRVWVDQPIRWTVSDTPFEWTSPPEYESDRGRVRLPLRPCSQC